MSLRFIINLGDKDKDDLEIEFWPDRKKAQAREITRQGVVHVDHEMNMQKVIDGLLGAIKESRGDRIKAEAKNRVIQSIPICTCDDHCDSPCPVHARENELQNQREELRHQLRVMQQALETERASHASEVAGLKHDLAKGDELRDEARALNRRLEARLSVLSTVVTAAVMRAETHYKGELTTGRDTREEWRALCEALKAAGYEVDR